MYRSQEGQERETGGCVEVSPNVRKSAELRALEVSKVKEERKADVKRVFQVSNKMNKC